MKKAYCIVVMQRAVDRDVSHELSLKFLCFGLHLGLAETMDDGFQSRVIEFGNPAVDCSRPLALTSCDVFLASTSLVQVVQRYESFVSLLGVIAHNMPQEEFIGAASYCPFRQYLDSPATGQHFRYGFLDHPSVSYDPAISLLAFGRSFSKVSSLSAVTIECSNFTRKDGPCYHLRPDIPDLDQAYE